VQGGIVLTDAPASIGAGLGAPIALGKKRTEAVVLPAARKVVIDRRPAGHEAALGLVAQHRDEFGTIIGLAA